MPISTMVIIVHEGEKQSLIYRDDEDLFKNVELYELSYD